MDSNDVTHDRRLFLQHVLGAGVSVAGTALLSGCAVATTTAGAQPASSTAGQPAATSGQWDMSWATKLGKYKTAYDSPQVEDGAGLRHAALAISGYKQAYGGTNPGFTPVIILRHAASIMTLNDAMWARLNLGAQGKLKDPTTGELNPKRNPFLTYARGDTAAYIGADSSITSLMEQGAIIMACNRALSGVAFDLKNREPNNFKTSDAALAEIRRNVIPGVYVMPNGVFAVAAAQDAGCNYMRVLT